MKIRLLAVKDHARIHENDGPWPRLHILSGNRTDSTQSFIVRQLLESLFPCWMAELNTSPYSFHRKPKSMCGQNGQKHNLFRRYMPIMVGAFLSLVAFVCSSCSETSSSLTIKQQVAWTLDKTMNAYNIPGAVVGSMVPGEEELVIRKGLADLETGSAIQTVDKFRIGSITKTFTATLILRLVDEGLLSLDDKLDEYVADIPYANKITIRQLCNNTSGLANYGENKDLIASIEKEPHRVWTPSELVDIAISMGQHFPGQPDLMWAVLYSNHSNLL